MGYTTHNDITNDKIQTKSKPLSPQAQAQWELIFGVRMDCEECGVKMSSKSPCPTCGWKYENKDG